MKTIKNKEYGGERPLYCEHGLRLEGVTIHAGESALKETADIEAAGCRFEGKYPFWCCKGFTVKRSYRGAEYEIVVSNPDGAQYGVKEVRVNGAPFAGKVIPVQAPGAHVRVEILMG